jgi:hypothetical protein
MRKYPKGCRYIQVVDGEIGPQRKRTQACEIEDLRHGLGVGMAFVAVQPRGKLKWYLFRAERSYYVMKLIATGYDPEPMIVEAILRG